MITRLYIDNFKSLCDFAVDMQRVNVFIGFNAVGKSTLLQVISLLKHFANGTVDQFLAERKWTGNEIKSKFNNRKNIRIEVWFEIDGKEIIWIFKLAPKGKGLTSVAETVLVDPKGDELVHLRRDTKKMWWFDFVEQQMLTFPKINLAGSMLSLIDVVSDPEALERFPILSQMKQFLNGIESFELLSPDKMRKSSQNESADLGTGGERIASFVHGLSHIEKERLNEQFRKFYPFAKSVTTVKKRAGWVDLSVEEAVRDAEPFQVNIKYLSDGLLRILFLAALGSLNDSYSAILLDEIEDGINPELAGVLVGALSEIAHEQNKQIFVTTHSPTFLDYFDAEQIQFLWRRENGNVEATRIFEIPQIKRHLKHMNPGEVWASYGQEELLSIIAQAEEETGDED